MNDDESPSHLRFHQLLLIATFLPLCWLAMMAIHELGHMVGMFASGGSPESFFIR